MCQFGIECPQMIEMEETFEALEGTLDLPAQAVQIQNVGRGRDRFGSGGHNQYIIGRVQRLG